jgi:3-dehydroquinate dehydratase
MRSSVDVRHELVKMYAVDDVEHFLSSIQRRELLRLTSYLEPERSKT